MREIKFRIWSKKHKKYFYNEDEIRKFYQEEDIHDKDLECEEFYQPLISYSLEINNHSNTDYILEQFTGLKDKNGKEIFEGDIIQHFAFDKGNTFVVEWDKHEGYQGYGVLSEWNRCEIIGNIHENQ